MPVHRLLLLGAPVLAGPEGSLPLPGPKAQALLWHLASQPGRALARSRLADLLWEDGPESAGRNSLNTMLCRLRHAAPAWPIQADKETVRWDSEVDFEVDVALFLQFTERARWSPAGGPHPNPDAQRSALAVAAALWRGTFLDGFETPGSESYAEWLAQERQHWEQQFLQLLERLVALDEAAAAWADLVTHARLALSIDPLQERFHRGVMQALHKLGDRAAALSQFAICRRTLATDLAIEPAAATCALRDEIAGHAGAGARDAVAACAASPIPSAALRRRTSSPATGDPARPLPALVGRARALSDVNRALAEAVQGRCPLVLVLGEAGIGKTRLIQEVLNSLRAPGRASGSVLLGHCHEQLQTVAYGPVLEALAEALPDLDIGGLGLSDAVWAEVARLLPEVAAFLPELPSSPELSQDQDRRRLFHALALLFSALPKPTVLVVEDLHWADEAALQLLSYLVRQPMCRGVAFVVTARSGDLGQPTEHLIRQLEREGLARQLELAPLPAEAIAALVTSVAGRSAADLAERIHTETGGNPLFALEFVRSFQEAGLLGGVPRPLAGLETRASVQAVILGRLHRLSAQAQHLAMAAAVFPSGAPFALLRAVSGLEEHAALDGFEAMLRAHFLRESETGAVTYQHDLIRRVVADSLSHARCESLNRRAFLELESPLSATRPSQTGADSLHTHGPPAEQLAFHAMAGGLWEQGLQWSRQAAAHARRVCAYPIAMRLLEQALDCLERLPDTAERRSQAVQIRLDLCQITFFSGPDRLRRWAVPAMADAMALGDQDRLAQLRLIQADVSNHLGHLQEALTSLAQVQEYAARAGNELVLARSLRAEMRIRLQTGELERSAALAESALPLFQRHGAFLDVVYVSDSLAIIRALLGQPDRAEALLRPIIPRCRTVGDRAALTHALAASGLVATLRGRWAETTALCQEALDEARVHGCLGEEFLARVFLSRALVRTGEPRAALSNLQRATAIAERLGSKYLTCLVQSVVADAHLALRDPVRAEAAARAGLAAANQQGSRLESAICLTSLGEAEAAAGRAVEARTRLREALRLYEDMGARPLLARTHAALARLGGAAAAAHTRAATAIFSELGMTWDLERLGYRVRQDGIRA